MRTRNNDRLLREYLKNTLMEFYGDGSFAVDTGGQMQWGVSGSDLAKAFIQPFTDVVSTAVGKSKELLARGGTLFKVTFEAVVSMLIPFVQGDYDKIFANEKKKIQNIRSQYKDVYARTDAALASGDASVLAFLASPGAVIVSSISKMAPEKAAALLSVVTAGAVDNYLRGSSEPSDLFSHHNRLGTILKEEKDKILKRKIDKILKNPKLISKIEKTLEPIASEIKDARTEKLNSALETAQKIIGAGSAKELEQKLGKKLPAAEVSKKLSSAKDLKNVDPKKIEKVLEKLPEGSLDFLKNTFIIPLEKEKAMLKKIGDEGGVKQYEQVISGIKSL